MRVIGHDIGHLQRHAAPAERQRQQEVGPEVRRPTVGGLGLAHDPRGIGLPLAQGGLADGLALALGALLPSDRLDTVTVLPSEREVLELVAGLELPFEPQAAETVLDPLPPLLPLHIRDGEGSQVGAPLEPAAQLVHRQRVAVEEETAEESLLRVVVPAQDRDDDVQVKLSGIAAPRHIVRGEGEATMRGPAQLKQPREVSAELKLVHTLLEARTRIDRHVDRRFLNLKKFEG